jgi:branched-chain amino acid transport system permease protein
MENGNLALQFLLSGITKGSIYAVVAIGFNLIYSATGVLNFAQGEFVMLGGMVAVTLAQFTALPVAVAGAVAVVALLGCLLEILFFRRLRHHSVLHHHRAFHRDAGGRPPSLGRESAVAALFHGQ